MKKNFYFPQAKTKQTEELRWKLRSCPAKSTSAMKVGINMKGKMKVGEGFA